MNNPGIFNLGDHAIAAAQTDEVITEGSGPNGESQAFIGSLDGMLALSLLFKFVFGSGGATVVAVVQTSLDQGQSWIDIARVDFATASVHKVVNLSGLLSKAVTAVAALSSEGVNDGVLGDRLRCKVTSTGTYAGPTSLSVRAVPR